MNRKKLNTTPPPEKPNKMRSPDLLKRSIFLRSFLEPQLFGEGSLAPYHTIFNMIDQLEAQLWGG
jgi:hypothetical protein